MGKGEIARNEHFLLFPQCCLPFWRTFWHNYQIWNCRLQTFSVWKSLKFVVWESNNSCMLSYRLNEMLCTCIFCVICNGRTEDRPYRCGVTLPVRIHWPNVPTVSHHGANGIFCMLCVINFERVCFQIAQTVITQLFRSRNIAFMLQIRYMDIHWSKVSTLSHHGATEMLCIIFL